MRLSTQEQQAVSQAIHQTDAGAAIYLFGSRADDTAKGGDIDLLVLSKKSNSWTSYTFWRSFTKASASARSTLPCIQTLQSLFHKLPYKRAC